MSGARAFKISVRVALALGLGTVLAVLPACGTDSATSSPAPASPPVVAPTPAPAVLAPPTVAPGDTLPAPKGETVLTLTGKIGSKNAAETLRLDPALLDEFGLVRVSVWEPWIKQDMQFQGVWLADVLKVAQTDGSAKTLHLTALDDYQIDLSIADVMAGGIMLATKTGDGAAIPIEDGGPTRIVFVSGNLSGTSADQWIWSLSTIDVR
jgi:hypothetical protein